jgi:predicted ATPase/transcriptional regulator with XRE-family HTH domain
MRDSASTSACGGRHRRSRQVELMAAEPQRRETAEHTGVSAGRARGAFAAQLRELRETAGFTQEELAAIAGLSVHAISALERGERRRPQVDTVRALSAALDLAGPVHDALVASARAPAPTAEQSGASLPLPLTVLVGREADVQKLSFCLAAPGVRLVTITGPGGVGKTRLALETARAIAEKRGSRVVFVGLGSVRTPSFVAPAIAEALGVLDATALDLPGRARAACDGMPTLLVLDNFEHVLDAAPLIADLLSAVATLSILATSRAPLRVRGEREYTLGPLALETNVESLPLADLAGSPAVRLFVERVHDLQPDFRLTSANVATVTAICRRLDALPLALELAAPWIKVLTPEDLLRRLARNVLLSPVGARDLPERQRTIDATVAWSYRLLGPGEQQAFRRFGALPGRFSIDAAAAVLAGGEEPPATIDDALRAAAGLVDKSLLIRAETPAPDRPVFRMLETVRAYAALELTKSGESDQALEGLARYCGEEAFLASQGLFGPAQAEWLNRVRDDLESYRGALTWLIERGRPAEAADIAWGLMYFWVIRGHAIEGLQWYEQVLKHPGLSPVAESKALVGAAMMWYSLGELAPAFTGLTRALRLAEGAGNAEMIAQAEHLLGHVEHALGNVRAARARLSRSVEGFRELAIPWGVGNSLNGLAKVAMLNGDAAEADRLLDDAASVLRRSSPWFLALVLFRRAALAVQRGHPDEAIALACESLTLFRGLNDTFAIVYALAPLAAAAAVKGDDLWTARILGARDAVTERTGATVVDKWVRALGECAERTVRARLAPDRWAGAYAAGRATSIDALMAGIERAAGSGADASRPQRAAAMRRAPGISRGSTTALAD